MLALPPVAPQTGWRSSLRLPRDHYVRLDSNDYSVHPAVIGRRVGEERITVKGCDAPVGVRAATALALAVAAGCARAGEVANIPIASSARRTRAGFCDI